MSPSEKAEIKTIVEAEIAKIERSVITLTELVESEVQSDANDWFTSKESNPSKEINDMALTKARQKIMVLKNVLNRIDSPDFGICIKCNKPIAFDRLRAMPSATRCTSC
ncbi:MAG TPA: TraR/DksA C4-type zinc finger protein [Bacteroidales bacterium]|nr:TraR/DksA C4-type zinc finger protein [Bacteroidales bacterium]